MFYLTSEGLKYLIKKEKEVGHNIDESTIMRYLVELQEKVIDVAKLMYGVTGHNHIRHGENVGKRVKATAESLGCSKGEAEVIALAAILHDMGKIYISPSILNKPGKLTEEEYEKVKKHALYGERILNDYFPSIAKWVKSHHERPDGKGYPKGLIREQIPFASKIIAVSDTFAAMTHKRTYNNTLTKEQAIEELMINRGTQFDPLILDVFVDVLRRTQ